MEAILAVVLAATLGASAAADTRPNIVLIIADDLGFNDVSFRGSNQIPTPNIDALAFSGVILDQHYVLPTCTPSRTAILTGQYPIRTGMQGYPLKAGEPRGLPLEFPTLPERLAELGYRTNLVGKWHQGYHHADYTPLGRGFHHHLGYWNGYMSYFTHAVHMDSPNGLAEGRIGFDLHLDAEPAWHLRGRYATHLFTEHAEDIILQHDSEAGPLYLQLAHLAAHAGLNGTFLEVPDEELNDRRHGYIAGSDRRHLAGIIREMDESVGRVVSALDRKGILDNTIIVFMADNGGETLGPHSNHASNWPLRGQKWTVYEGGVRGAAVVWSPRLARPGSVHQGLVHATDWLPTFYEAAGGNVSDLGPLDGLSQWGSLTSAGSLAPRSEVLVNIDEAGALIQRDWQADWKLVRGQQSADRSGYVGESGRGPEVPEYNVSAVLGSAAAAALGRHVPPLTASLVARRRAQASAWHALCPEDAANAADTLDLACAPYCLFNLRVDPCEAVDVRDSYRDVGDRLLQRLAYWENLTVPQINQPVDEAADPRKHNMTWVSWLDPQDQPSGAAGALPATLATTVVVVLVVLAVCSL
ncbi:Arylsulfatase B [Frankliniella fusca]|uniref:Arylsulfatase B n=1 Tax=Frankliniella fusca TaxID=407009 RepID=A0AAE1HAM9_9NEOP|nr:Arylsulfatase B [Frankliniella fusca]